MITENADPVGLKGLLYVSLRVRWLCCALDEEQSLRIARNYEADRLVTCGAADSLGSVVHVIGHLAW